jgi:dipeptide transport system substrate-binding protein
VRFSLGKPTVAFPAMLAVETFGIVSAEYSDLMMKAGTPEKTATEPIGTGPFAFVSYQKDAMIRYRAHPDHWARSVPGMDDRTAKVDNLVMLITIDPSVRYAKLKAGECQIMRFPNPADIKLMRADPDIQVHEIPGADYAFLGYNTEKKPFQDKRVRLALSLAIDKKNIMDAVYLGETGIAAGALIPPSLPGHDPSIKPYPYDPERAKKLLAEAGYPNGFTADLWAMPVVRVYMPNARRTAELVQADLAKVGVTVNIKTVEWGQYLKRTQDGEHEMVILGWNYPNADPGQIPVLGWSCVAARNGFNRSRWCHKEFDDLIFKAEVTKDEAQRLALYRSAQKLFYDEAPAILIAYATKLAMTRKSVVGYKLTPVGSETFFGVGLKE